jgi:hypothetical protein
MGRNRGRYQGPAYEDNVPGYMARPWDSTKLVNRHPPVAVRDQEETQLNGGNDVGWSEDSREILSPEGSSTESGPILHAWKEWSLAVNSEVGQMKLGTDLDEEKVLSQERGSRAERSNWWRTEPVMNIGIVHSRRNLRKSTMDQREKQKIAPGPDQGRKPNPDVPASFVPRKPIRKPGVGLGIRPNHMRQAPTMRQKVDLGPPQWEHLHPMFEEVRQVKEVVTADSTDSDLEILETPPKPLPRAEGPEGSTERKAVDKGKGPVEGEQGSLNPKETETGLEEIQTMRNKKALSEGEQEPVRVKDVVELGEENQTTPSPIVRGVLPHVHQILAEFEASHNLPLGSIRAALNKARFDKEVFKASSIFTNLLAETRQQAHTALKDRDYKNMSVCIIANPDRRFKVNGYGGFVETIVDTGALPNIISTAAYFRLPKETRPKVETSFVKLATVSSGDQSVFGQIDKMEMSFGDDAGQSVSIVMPFLVVEATQFEILIGTQTLMSLGAKIDFRKEMLELCDIHETGEKVVFAPLSFWNRNPESHATMVSCFHITPITGQELLDEDQNPEETSAPSQ